MNAPTSAISSPQQAQRTEISETGIEELAKSIKAVGLLQPLVVKEAPHGWEVVAGHRRLLACRMLGLSEVTVRVVKADEATTHAMMLSENLQRMNLSPVDEARAVTARIEILGESVAEISTALGKSEPWVRGRMDMMSWPAVALEAVERGSLSMAAVRPLLDIDDAGERDRLLDCAITSGANAQVTASWACAVRGLAAESMDDAPAYRRTQGELAVFVLKMPCFCCRREFPGLELRVLRCCEECVVDLQAAIGGAAAPPANLNDAGGVAGGSTTEGTAGTVGTIREPQGDA